jgi:hypothetical protein
LPGESRAAWLSEIRLAYILGDRIVNY